MRTGYRNRRLTARKGKGKNKRKYQFITLILIFLVGGLVWRDFNFDTITKAKLDQVTQLVTNGVKTLKSFNKASESGQKIKVVSKETGETTFEFYDNEKTAQTEIYYLNLLNTTNFSLADKLRAHATLLGFSVKIKTKGNRFLVTSGPYNSLKVVLQVKNRLLAHKIKSVLVTVKQASKN